MTESIFKVIGNSKTVKLRLKRFHIVLIAFVALSNAAALAATITTTGSGNWSSTTANAPWPGGTIPAATDDIIIGAGFTLTVDGNRTCNSITIGNGSSLSVSSGMLLTVPTSITFPDVAGANVTGTITGAGSATAASMAVGTTVTPTATRTTNWTSTISSLTISGNLTLTSSSNGTGTRLESAVFNQTSGTITVNGSVTTVNANAANTTTYTMGNTSPTLVLGGATPFTPSGAGTTTFTLNGTGATVNYDYGGAQTVYVTTYQNLILSGGGAKTFAITTVNGNLTLSGTAAAAMGANLTVGGNLSIGDGTTFTAGAFTLAVTGTTTVGGGTSGTLAISSATGTKTFTGLVTINTGATWNNAANEAVTFLGGITNNGTFNAGTGLQTFSTNAQSLTGTISIPSVTVTGITVTNNGTLTVTTALAGTGGLTNTGTLNINFGGALGITTLTATANGNTVNYEYPGAQTIFGVNYYNLALSGSGAKTLQAGTTTVSGNLTLSGTATTAIAANFSIVGNLSIGDGTTFTAGAFNLTVTGTTTIGNGASGSLTISSVTGTKTFTGLVTVNAGATWNNTANEAITFQGGATNNGTFNAGTGIYTYNTNPQTLSGTNGFAFTAVTSTVALTFNTNVTVSGNLAIPTGITFTNNSAVTITGNLTGGNATSSIWLNTANSTLIVGGAVLATGTLTATAAGNTVNYNGAAAQTVKATTYYNLTLSGGGANTTTGVTVNGVLSMEGTATASVAPTYGTAATLQYNTTTARTAGAEWVANFSASGGIIIGSTGAITMNSAEVVNAPIMINNGATLRTNSFALTLGGNFANNGGTFTAGSSIITISGTGTQSIAGFTTTGSVNMTKTGGTATLQGAISSGDLILNGAGGTLNLGASLNHSVANLTVTNGTLNLGASTINITGNLTNNGTITTGGSTVTFNGTTAQTISGTGLSFNNLTINNSNPNGVSLGVPASVAGTLTLTSGTVTTSSTNLLTITNTGSITGASSASFIVGSLAMTLPANVGADGTTYSFPVGDPGNYRPLSLVNIRTGAIAPVVIVTESASGAVSPDGTTIASIAPRNWYVQASSGNFTSATIQLTESGLIQTSVIGKSTAQSGNYVSIGGTNIGTTITSAQTVSSFPEYFAIGISVIKALYSYQAGDWSSATTWTTDASGTVWTNARVPGAADSVVVLNGRTVSITSNNKMVTALTLKAGGILDIKSTTGHNFGTVSGQGKLMLSSNNFPGGTFTNFVASNGGTVEYYNLNNVPISNTQFTYNNLIISDSSATNSAYLNNASNPTTYIIYGNFSLKNYSGGSQTLYFGNPAASDNLINMTVYGNFSVDAGCNIRVNNFASSHNIPNALDEGATPYPVHTLNLYGNFTNNGVVRFTGLPSPVANAYYTLATTAYNPGTGTVNFGDVQVFFYGAGNNTVTCNDTTDFYRFIVAKGTDETYTLEVISSSTSNFALYGPNFQGGDNFDGGTNKYGYGVYYKALFIHYGTLKLDTNIYIPSLTEGGQDFNVIPTAGLWINGANVSTTVSGQNGTSYQAATLYGSLRISAGEFSTRDAAGVVLGTLGTPTVTVEGSGLLDVSMVWAAAGTTNLMSFIQTGGTVNFRGQGELDNTGAMLALTSPSASFVMSGGTINFMNGLGATDPNIIDIESQTGYFHVTGGTVNINLPGSTTSYTAKSTAPFYNLNISRNGTTNSTLIQWNTPGTSLNVLNDLNIGANSVLNLGTSGIDLFVGHNFTLTGTYTPATGAANVTAFNGTGNQYFYNAGTITNGYLNNLTITNSSNTFIVSNNLTVNGILTIDNNSVLNDSGRVVTVNGNIVINGTHKSSMTTGSITLGGTAAQTISGNGAGVFNNLTLNKTGGSVTVPANITITGNLRLAGTTAGAWNILNIGSNKLSLGANAMVYSDMATGTAFANNRMIQTSGNASDGGITKSYSSTTTFLFPFGFLVAATYYYLPASIQYASAPTTYGTVTTRPVNARHPLAQGAANALTCYWKTTSAGFAGVPAGTVNLLYYYNDAFVPVPANEASYIAAYYNSTSWLTSGFTINTTADSISFRTLSSSDGEFTAGLSTAFGAILTLYSRASGDWNTNSTWSLTPHGTAYTDYPHATTVAYIDSGTNVATTHADSSANLTIQPTAMLEIQSNAAGNSFGTVANTLSVGSGTLRIDTSGYFPKGDWGSFLGTNGGTVEYYQKSTATLNLPTVYTLPNGGTANIGSYCNLITSPYAGGNINLPHTNLTIYNNLTVGSDTAGGNSNCTTRIDTANTTTTLEVKGVLSVNRYGVLQYQNGAAQNVIADSDVTIMSGGTLKVRYGGVSSSNNLTVYGNLVNNGTLDLDSNTTTNTYYCNLQFAGFNSKSLMGSTAIRTHLYGIIVNKGVTLDSLVNVTIDTTGFQMGGGGLLLQNGTFRLTSPVTMALSSAGFTIPVTGGLSANGGTFNMAQTATGDLTLKGRLEVLAGAVNVGPSVKSGSTVSASILYSAAGNPTIFISGGSLNVYSQIRRDTANNSGSLNFTQTGGIDTIGGKNPKALRAAFEDLNDGSSFVMSGGSLIIANGSINTISPYDVDIEPDMSNVTGGTLQLGLSGATQTTFRFETSIPLWNLTLDSNSNAVAIQEVYNSTMLGSLTIGGVSSYYSTSGLDLEIGGNFVNNNSNNSTGLKVGGFQADSVTQTTSFLGTADQTITGTSSNQTNFANLEIATASSDTTYLTGGKTTVVVNGDLTLTSGTFNDDSNSVYLMNDVDNNAIHASPSLTKGGLIFDGSSNQGMTGSGSGVFGNIEINNSGHGVNMTDNSMINGQIKFTSGYLYIDDYALTLGARAAVAGTANATHLILLNGVLSDKGVTKIFPRNASSFTFPIGANGKYTPASFYFSSNNNNAGSIQIIPVDGLHPSINPDSVKNYLNYYWNISSTGFSSSYSVTDSFTFVTTDTVGQPANIERYDNTNSKWSTVGNTITPPRFWFSDSTFIDGSYTIGEMFATLPILYSFMSGSWFNSALWYTDTTHHVAYNKIPKGNPVVIRAQDSVYMDQNSANAVSAAINGVLDAENTTFHNIGQISGGGKMRISSTSSGYFAFPGGTYDAFFANPASTVEFYGKTSGRLPLDPGNTTKPYQNVIFSDTSTKYVSSVDTKVLGRLIIRKGSVLDNSQYNKNIYVFGNWIDSNTVAAGFNPGTGTVYFSDTAGTQLIIMDTSSMTETFYNLAVDNPSGVTISKGNAAIGNQLILTLGNITTSSTDTLTITNSDTAAVVGGGVNSFVNGPLRKRIANGSSFRFPVGDSASSGRNRFGYVYVRNTSTSGTQMWIAQFVDKNPTVAGYNIDSLKSPLRSIDYNEYWSITGPTVGTANVALSWDQNTGMSNSSAARALSTVAEWGTPSANNWNSAGNVVYDFGQDSGLVSTSTLLNFSGTQVFTIGSSAAAIAAMIKSIASGVWNNPAIWNVGRLPGPIDTVLIDANRVALNAPVTVSSFAVNKGGAYNDSSFTLTVTGNVALNGTWAGSGTLNLAAPRDTLYGTGTSTGNSTLELSGGNAVITSSLNLLLKMVSILASDTLNNYASVTVDSIVNVATGSVLHNFPGSELVISGTSIVTASTGKIVIDSGANYINLSSSTPMLQVQTRITGKDGWRMVAAPTNVSVGSMFAAPLVTQGFTGSTYPSMQPNLMWWDETSQGTSLQAWRQPSNTSDTVALGRGYMYYVFNGTQITGQSGGGNYGDALPLTMSALGPELPLTTAFDFRVTATMRSPGGTTDTTYTDTNYADYGWNLIGNPTPSTINWNASSGWTRTNVDGTVYVWDPNDTTGGYRTWNGTIGTLGSGLIGPFQAFWVKATGANPSLKCDNGVKSSGGILLENTSRDTSRYMFPGKIAKTPNGGGSLKKAADDSATSPPVLSLSLSADGLQAQAFLMFDHYGKLSYNPYDAFSLVPLSNKYLMLYTLTAQGQLPMQIQDLPDTGFAEPVSIPLYVGGASNGQPSNASFSLQWKLKGRLPAGWSVALMDDYDSKAYNVVSGGEIIFQYNTPADLVPSSNSFLEKKSGTGSDHGSITALPWPVVHTLPASKLSKTASVSPRFRLVISANSDLSGYLPTTPELAQNYPNPFNPTTNIAFSLPARSRVSIEVFNVLGQKIATVVDQEYSPGSHVVTWTPRTVASGVYFCRMISGSHKKTIKMVLLR